MPRETLTRDQIVQAAVELLDAEGIEGLSMRKLGMHLDSSTMAVYWHVKNKDDLIRLVGDQVWNEIELPDLAATHWRGAARAMAVGLHDMLARHPWLVQALGSYLVYGPGKARFDDHLLAVYEKAGFGDDEADRAAAAVFMLVLGSALGTSASTALARRLERTQGDSEAALNDAVAKASETADAYPRLSRRLGAPAADDYLAAPRRAFEAGLDALLAGLAARRADVGDAARGN